MKKKCNLIKRLMAGEKVKVLLYHHIDLDGYGALILMKYLEREFTNLTLFNIECVSDAERIYDDNNTTELCVFDYIFIADLSIKTVKTAKLLESLNNSGLNIYIVDHHTTALWLNDYDYANIVPHDLDNGVVTCGTSLLFDLLNNTDDTCTKLDNKYVTDFISNVKEYDTYLWKRTKNNKAENLNLLIKFSLDKIKFVTDIVDILYSSSYVLGDDDNENYLKLLIYSETVTNEINLSEKLYKTINVNIKGNDLVCGYLYINNYYSEIGNALCERHRDIDFMMMINRNNGKVSFRSIKDIDLTEIVKPLGGGGHKLAAGCTLPLDKYNCSIEEILYHIFYSLNEKSL